MRLPLSVAFGGTVSLFLLVLGSTVTQIQWDKINCDWSSERKCTEVSFETPVEKEKVMVCKVKTGGQTRVLFLFIRTVCLQTLQSGDNILFYGKFVLRTMQVIRMSLIMLLICCGNRLAGLLMCMPDIGVLWTNRVCSVSSNRLCLQNKIVRCYRQWGFKGERNLPYFPA